MVGRRNPRPPKGSLELEIVAGIAAADGPLTAAEVLSALGRPLAYTTVLTTLTRLFEKQVLTREPRGRAYAYRLVGGNRTEAEAWLTAREMQKVLDTGNDRASVLTQFVGSLDETSEQLLRELLQRHPGLEPVTKSSSGHTDGPPE